MTSRDELLKMLVGKCVQVTHPTVPDESDRGMCCDVLEIDENSFILCLTHGRRFAVMAEIVTEEFIEGRIYPAVLTRRRVTIINTPML